MHTANNLFIKMGNLYKVFKSLLKIENKISLHNALCGHEVNALYKNPKYINIIRTHQYLF
jgi:hypothetical protein